MVKGRIRILDGFRAIAVISVMLYHYYSQWAPLFNKLSLYPYSGNYSYFRLGYLGVQLFFIISGFVIFYTLELTPTFIEFWKKRLIRLYPGLVIISFITFLVFYLFDTQNILPKSHSVLNFQFSLTLIDPQLFNVLLSHWHLKFGYLNASFWTLWPEVKFYLLASILYYSNKQKFARNFITLIFGIVIVSWAISALYWAIFQTPISQIGITPDPISHTWLFTFIKYFWFSFCLLANLPEYWVHFTLGVIYYLLYTDKQNGIKSSSSLKITLLVFVFFQCANVTSDIILINLLMNILFICFIYFPKKLGFLENKYITGIGVISYFIYLFHENIGVLLIAKLGHYFMPRIFILPILIIFFFILTSWLYNKYIDLKISKFLKKHLLRDNNLKVP